MRTFSKAIVIGSTGGIGHALAERISSLGGEALRLSRGSNPAIDYDRPETIAAAAEEVKSSAPYDLVIVATGILHSEEYSPEKNWKALEAPALDRYFRINATGPALVARHFLPLLSRGGIFAALSARVGSIGDNRLGGWYGYRASKAALNQIVRTLAIEEARKSEGKLVVALHPGTVDTPLSSPFQRNVAEKKLFDPDKSAARLIDVLSRMTPEQSGAQLDWAGKVVIP
ncbi:SDR family NAD(P)-dependent oxidoreductase [Sphingomicrobium lutaoense]|uniref:NAD(P)-dependent dehydrogenase (Short-subunit alcohol dehydrogenase family) n=1 Tax=Sphingomicrobium lutaoense TaxID=515949 RepID=A0A839Z0D3_9SPHN|nr:SDR family NAD(P)-dependent oxidoreductase [Sphingomicrobium lutaoense]MBB3763142.1 NAD(P)-dependent dehydrogenase (short-subunit alcohol dehydrogenase family) [Sphingomicrobium lutaoense]